MKSEIIEYKVNEALMKREFKKCLVCGKKFQLGEKIVLCPIQEKKLGWATVMAIPIHSKCYWIDEDLKEQEKE